MSARFHQTTALRAKVHSTASHGLWADHLNLGRGGARCPAGGRPLAGGVSRFRAGSSAWVNVRQRRSAKALMRRIFAAITDQARIGGPCKASQPLRNGYRRWAIGAAENSIPSLIYARRQIGQQLLQSWRAATMSPGNSRADG